MAEQINNTNIPDFEFPEWELELPESVEKEEENPIEENSKKETKDIVIESDPKAIAYFEELKSRGYVDESKEFKGTWEELDQYFDSLPQQVLDSVVQSLPEISKDVMKFIATAGDNITKEEMKSFFETYFEDNSNKEITIETSDDARQYLENHYKELGLRPKSITSTLDALEGDDELLEEAKRIFEEKTKQSKVQKVIEDKSKQNDIIRQKNQERVQRIQEELNTIGWKKEVITEVAKVLSGNNFNNNLQKIINDPKGLIQLANITRLFNEKTGEFDLSAFIKQVDTKTVRSLKDKLEDESFSSSGVSTKHRESNPNTSNGMENLEIVL